MNKGAGKFRCITAGRKLPVNDYAVELLQNPISELRVPVSSIVIFTNKPIFMKLPLNVMPFEISPSWHFYVSAVDTNWVS
jgi:hypothetical protein